MSACATSKRAGPALAVSVTQRDCALPALSQLRSSGCQSAGQRASAATSQAAVRRSLCCLRAREPCGCKALLCRPNASGGPKPSSGFTFFCVEWIAPIILRHSNPNQRALSEPTPTVVEPLAAYFVPGFASALPPELTALQRAQPMLDAFTALFAPGEAAVLVRLWVLRTLAARQGDPRWTTQELDATFAPLEAAKRNTVLSRLKDHGLLVWDVASQAWHVSVIGRMVLAALAHLLEVPEGSDADLSYITAELVGAESQGRVPHEVLHLLLSKYHDLQRDLEDAVTSGSERLLREAQSRLKSVQDTVAKGTEIIRKLTARDELNAISHREAQAIGQAQARILRMSAVFDRELGKHDRNRVLMGASGLSSQDIGHWLRGQTAAQLSALLQDALAVPPQLPALDAETLADIAEHETSRERRSEVDPYALPGSQVAPVVDTPELEDFSALAAFTDALASLRQPTPLADLLPLDDFSLAAYRLSLLSLVGTPITTGLQVEVAALLKLPLALTIEKTRSPQAGSAVVELSDGTLTPKF